eukprot:jgi/Tetstr1/435491/TSEL_024396.t1
MARREDRARCVPAFSANQPAASEFCRQCGKSTTVDGLAVVGEEALVSAVTEAICDCLNGHHMQGGLKPATATFRGMPADLLVSLCEARPEMWHARGGGGGGIVSTLYPLSLEVEEGPFWGQCNKLKVVKGTAYFHTGVVAAKVDTDMELPTDY